jgi:hypothetical protein
VLNVCIVAVALAVAPLLRAQPADVTRVLRNFDFEERRYGNDEDLPMHWIKVEGPGFPHYVNGCLSTDQAHGGRFSFRFTLNGGSLAYRYGPGDIRVQPGAHYRIEGFCRTTVLRQARARITAYFTDQDGHALRKSVQHSELYAAARADDPWHALGLELSADDPQAAYLVLQLELLQPDQYVQSSLGKRALYVQDIRGSAWFDDISISEVPRVYLTTDRPGNIFRASDILRLHVRVNDRFTDDLEAQLVLTDATGRIVYQRSGSLKMNAVEDIGHNERRLALDLPAVPAGWYEAALQMSSQGQSLGDEKLDLIRLADEQDHEIPDDRFGIVATTVPFQAWSALPGILPYLGAGRVKLALWSKAGDAQDMDPVAFDRLLTSLGELGITPTACLLALPPEVARNVEADDWDALLKVRTDTWQPQLAYLIARHANHLDRWQLGDDGSDAFVTDPAMRKVYSLIYEEFAKLVSNPDLAMPWPAWYELAGQLPATVALSVSPSVLPSQLPLYMQEIAGYQGHNLSLSIQLLDRHQYGRDAQICDLAERVIYALSAGAKRIDLPAPFTASVDGDNVIYQPQELLMIERTLTSLLSGTTYLGRVPLGEGIDAFCFDRDGRGILALWSKGNTSGVKSLALDLGDRASRVDLWGNVTPLFHPSASGVNDQLPLMVTTEPIFIVDIDGPQAQLRASVAVNQPLLESSFEPHNRRIRFTNTYRQPINGSLKLRAPAGWTLNPPTFQFSLNPGESFERDFSVEFPYNSFAGPKTLNCDFTLSAERTTSFTVPLTLELGLSDVGMQSLALRDGNDVVVQQMITNYGEQPINYSSFAVFPGQARQERLVTNLGPGRTVLKRYRFPNVQLQPDTHIRVGVKELDGTRILNEDVEVR